MTNFCRMGKGAFYDVIGSRKYTISALQGAWVILALKQFLGANKEGWLGFLPSGRSAQRERVRLRSLS